MPQQPPVNSLANVMIWTIILAPLVAAVYSFFFRKHQRRLALITPLVSAISLAASVWAAQYVQDGQVLGPIQFLFFNLRLDALSIYFVLLVNLVALFASFSVQAFLRYDRRHNPNHRPNDFHALFNAFHLTMLLVPMVNNLVMLWIAVELTTVFSTILVFYRRDRASLEAAWKFIMITTTGIIFALLGTLFLANSLPKTVPGTVAADDLLSWFVLAKPEVAASLNPNYVRLSFLFILLGYGTKAGLAPMHTWLPDGHGQAPAPVSALLSGVMLKSALYAILRFYTITNVCLNQHAPIEGPFGPAIDRQFTSYLLLGAGLLSLVLATPFILKRNRFKRVLAYHSLEHMGIIVFGIGIGGPVALFGALLHTLNHALTKALMFLLYGSIQYEYQEQCGADTEVEGGQNIQGVLRAMPLSGTILAFGGLALVGSPPFNIFMSEFMILWGAIQRVFTGQGVVGEKIVPGAALLLFVITITLIFGGLVGHLARLLLGSAPFAPVEPSLRRARKLLPFFFLIAIIILFGVLVPTMPVDFPSLLRQSVTIVQGPLVSGTAGVP